MNDGDDGMGVGLGMFESGGCVDDRVVHRRVIGIEG